MGTDQMANQNIINLEQHLSQGQSAKRKIRRGKGKILSSYQNLKKKIYSEIYIRLVWPTIDF